MKHIVSKFSIVLFSIFLGSQITEGCLLVPYWQSLSVREFYTFYKAFGPTIGHYYSFLTITAVLIPITFSIFCLYKKSSALTYAALSSFFAILVIALFFIYFKHTNQEFYLAALNANQLATELQSWEKWHWFRVSLEALALVFLTLAHVENSKYYYKIINTYS